VTIGGEPGGVGPEKFRKESWGRGGKEKPVRKDGLICRKRRGRERFATFHIDANIGKGDAKRWRIKSRKVLSPGRLNRGGGETTHGQGRGEKPGKNGEGRGKPA